MTPNALHKSATGRSTVYRAGLTAGLILLSLLQFSCTTGTKRQLKAEEEWYKGAYFYHIWVNAFADSDGDGIGDLQGIIDRLDYIESLGIDGIWLSPIFHAGSESQTFRNMHGYDVIDHYAVNPYFGDIRTLESLIRKAHSRGIRVIFDFVPNHVSSEHPWFIAASDPTHPEHEKYRDYFVWSDENLDRYYKGPWNQSTWHGPADNGLWYYGVFNSGMPDLNYENPAVHEEMRLVMTHWLDFGFDGLRVDAVKFIYEDDTDGDPTTAPVMEYADATLELFADLREEVLQTYADRGTTKFMVVENWAESREFLHLYAGYQNRPAAHSAFDFDMGNAVAGAVLGKPGNLAVYLDYLATLKVPEDYAWSNFLSNHDNVRSRPITLFNGEVHQVAMAAGYNILLAGIPFTYYGNEIGMPGLSGSDTNLRQAFDWATVESQTGDAESLLEWYRAIGAIRKEYPVVGTGDFACRLDEKSEVFTGFWHGEDGSPDILFVVGHGPENADLRFDTTPFGGDASENDFSVLVGSPGGAALSDGVFTIGGLPPSAFRVFALGSDDEPQLIGDRGDVGIVYSTEVFLPGQWNGWNNADEKYRMRPDDSREDVYYFDKVLRTRGSLKFDFKVFDGTWLGFADLNVDADASHPELTLVSDGSNYDNLRLSVPETGTYRIFFDQDKRVLWITGSVD